MKIIQRLIAMYFFLALVPTAFSQNREKFRYWNDTSEVLNVLNGTWEMKLRGEKYKMTFSFDPVKLECIDSVNKNWYTDGTVKYVLDMNSDRIYLREYEFFEDMGKFDATPSTLEIWIIDKKTFMLNIGADFGIFIVRKKRKN